MIEALDVLVAKAMLGLQCSWCHIVADSKEIVEVAKGAINNLATFIVTITK